MNFSEFKKILGADPYCTDAEFLRARNSSPEFAQAAKAALDFEARLKNALELPVPQDMLGTISAVTDAPEEPAGQPWWFQMAAAALLAVGVAAGAWWQSGRNWQSVDEYLTDHWSHDGRMFLEMADGETADNARAVFASLGMKVSPEYARHIDFIKACRTPGSRGAHFVFNTENGPVTVIYMPSVREIETKSMTVDGMLARALPLTEGSIMVIGPDRASIEPLFAMTRNALKPISQTA